MKSKNFLILLLSFTFLILGGCLHESDDDDTTNPNNKSNAKTALEGTWNKGCTYDADEELYLKEEFKITNNNYFISAGIYSDATCTISEMSFARSGNFTIGSSIILDSGTTVNKIDATNTSTSITLGSDETVIAFNTIALCGKNNWEKNVSVDISNCSEMTGANMIYDIFKIDGSKLIFGDEDTGDAESESTRPTALAIDDFFTKSS